MYRKIYSHANSIRVLMMLVKYRAGFETIDKCHDLRLL